MRAKLPVLLFLISTILIINCYGNPISTTTKPATTTSTPSKEPTSTITPTLTETPHPTSIYQPTISAFENLLKNVCPTTTPNPAQNITENKIADDDILREFAGNYSKSDGFWVYALVLNCDGSFYQITFPDTGGVFIDQGIVEVQDGKILFKITNRSEPHTIIYIPLRWGQRKYIIYNDDTERFCEALTTQYGYKEPVTEDSIIRLFYLRIGDDSLGVPDLPVLPNGKKICK